MISPTLLLLFDTLLVVTLLALAFAALLSPEPRRAVVLFIVFGVWLSLVWARLNALDVALAQAVIGAGLGGAFLLAAARRLANAPASSNASSPASPPASPKARRDGGGDER